MRVTLPSACVILALALFSAVLLPVAAEAGGLSATLLLSSKKPPASGTEKSLLGFARANSAKKLMDGSWEKGGEDVKYEDRVFKAWLITKFSRALDDFEFQIVFYDVTDGSRQYVDAMSSMITKGEKTFVTPIVLKRGKFRPNRKMEIVVTAMRQEAGSIKFMTEGKEKQNSGVVDFGKDGT